MAIGQASQEYRLLSSSNEDISDSSRAHVRLSPSPSSRFLTVLSWHRLGTTLGVLLLVAFSFALGRQSRDSKVTPSVSPYLSLNYDQPDQLWWNTDFSSETASDRDLDELWDTHIPWEKGIIALRNEEARAMNLPESQPWPWDSKGKSIYIVNAHHILHCVRNLYISIQQYRTNKTQTINYPHILHCLDSLRAETMCTADDTLRYIPLNSDGRGFRPGDGQTRQCRSWDKVQDFVEAHDPCYQYQNPGDTKLSNLERFKFCPSDSQYLPKIRKYFGYADDWVPEPQEGPRELEW